MKKAFTLVELLFVMVVLAIIAGVGTDILRSLFDNYAVTAQIHRLESVANNAADTIATRLEKRVPQTTAIETVTGTSKKYEPLSAIGGGTTGIGGGTTGKSGKLVFFRKAYELERNFISAKNGGAEAPRTSGFISELKTTTTTTTAGDSRNFTDRVEFVSKETDLTGLNLNDYELFFSNDSSLLYENKAGNKITATFNDRAAAGTTNAILVSATATGEGGGNIIDDVNEIKLNGFAFNIGTESR